ncbi:hypothetical protein L9F63_011428, partial [Diploptera punctata]
EKGYEVSLLSTCLLEHCVTDRQNMSQFIAEEPSIIFHASNLQFDNVSEHKKQKERLSFHMYFYYIILMRRIFVHRYIAINH